MSKREAQRAAVANEARRRRLSALRQARRVKDERLRRSAEVVAFTPPERIQGRTPAEWQREMQRRLDRAMRQKL